MSDDQIRRLERLAAQGDVEARQQLWFARQRTGLPPWEWWPEQFASLRHQIHIQEITGTDLGISGNNSIVDELRRFLLGQTKEPCPRCSELHVAAILLEDRPQEWNRNDLGVPTSRVTPVFMYTFTEHDAEPQIIVSNHWSDPLKLKVDNWARMKKQEPVTIEEVLTRRDIPIYHVPLGFFPTVSG